MNTEHRTPNHNIRTRGFTLAEAIMATIVLGIAATGVLLPFASGAKVRAEGVRMTMAANLASDLIEKIINTSFDEIEDFVVEHQEDTFTDPMYANFSRGASCDYVYVPQQAPREPSQCNFIRATVWVKYNGREIVDIKRLISR